MEQTVKDEDVAREPFLMRDQRRPCASCKKTERQKDEMQLQANDFSARQCIRESPPFPSCTTSGATWIHGRDKFTAVQLYRHGYALASYR